MVLAYRPYTTNNGSHVDSICYRTLLRQQAKGSEKDEVEKGRVYELELRSRLKRSSCATRCEGLNEAGWHWVWVDNGL